MSTVLGLTLRGTRALCVEVEAEVTGGLFAIAIVGLPDASVREARERVRAALRTVDIPLRGRVTVNLAPADIPKEGALLDLPLAVALACRTGAIDEVPPALFMGELALDGRLRRVRGAVPAALLARTMGLPLFVPLENVPEVALVEGIIAYGVPDLPALFAHLRGEAELSPVVSCEIPEHEAEPDPDMADVKGQFQAKRGLEIAAAGHHNIFLVGSPGSGKTMLARALRGILPPLSKEDFMEVLLVRSTLGVAVEDGRRPPYRAVHHTATLPAICGGGSGLRPGEISRAHRGVLFLDEFPEFPRDLVEALRQPLEDGEIVVSRASGSVTYPSRVLLVAAANPCPCGNDGDPSEPCRCSASERERYARRLSGPILDRIDLYVSVPRLTPEELVAVEGHGAESSADIRRRVTAARERQRKRWTPFGFGCNAEVPEKLLRKELRLGGAERRFLEDAARRCRLSGRGLSRILRVARTVADLEGADAVGTAHLAEALAYRQGGNAWTTGSRRFSS